MKFNCGLTRRAWAKMHHALISEWHSWFAWWPVRVGECDCRWLERVERRYKETVTYLEIFREPKLTDFEYRPMQTVHRFLMP